MELTWFDGLAFFLFLGAIIGISRYASRREEDAISLVVIDLYLKLGIYTMPEFLLHRYGEKARMFLRPAVI